MESSKEKRMVISLILFRCAKHSILPRKTGTWEKRIPSSYGQNSIAQSHKMQYLSQFFFYRSSLTIQHKILFQRLSGFDNKQQISDLGGFMYGFAANQNLLQHYVEVFNGEIIAMLHPYQFAIDEENAKRIMEMYDYDWTDDEI